MPLHRVLCVAMSGLVCVSNLRTTSAAEPNPQYELGDIKIPAASADEAKLEQMSLPLALHHIQRHGLPRPGPQHV